jgi:ssDNA-binding Zn-finger/Zn-ribbon topoisomerase 1
MLKFRLTDKKMKTKDETDDLEAGKCSKCGRLMIKQEIDESWFCENCDKPHGEGKPLEVDEINYRKCVKCGKNSGIFELCVDCRPSD